MNRKLLAAVVSGTLAVSMAAQVQAQAQADQTDEMQADEMQADEMQADEMEVHEHKVHEHSFTLYGSVRSGIYMQMPQNSTNDQWDVGTIDNRFGSQIGVRSSTELGGGMTAGLNLERFLGDFSVRHQNVWLSSAFGTVTLGQQNSSYNSNTSWDNTNLFGAATGLVASRVSGAISYQSNPGGPFSFSALVSDSDSNAAASPTGSGPMDQIEVGGTLSAGSVSFGAGYQKIDINAANTSDLIGGTVSGSLGGVGWAVGFESQSFGTGTAAPDVDRFGFNVDYTTEAGRAYVYYEDAQADLGSGVSADADAMVFGYQHTIGPGVIVITEYQLPSSPNPDQLGVVVRVDF